MRDQVLAQAVEADAVALFPASTACHATSKTASHI
jgi:hypothetical protein